MTPPLLGTQLFLAILSLQLFLAHHSLPPRLHGSLVVVAHHVPKVRPGGRASPRIALALWLALHFQQGKRIVAGRVIRVPP